MASARWKENFTYYELNYSDILHITHMLCYKFCTIRIINKPFTLSIARKHTMSRRKYPINISVRAMKENGEMWKTREKNAKKGRKIALRQSTKSDGSNLFIQNDSSTVCRRRGRLCLCKLQVKSSHDGQYYCGRTMVRITTVLLVNSKHWRCTLLPFAFLVWSYFRVTIPFSFYFPRFPGSLSSTSIFRINNIVAVTFGMSDTAYLTAKCEW